MSLLGLKGPSGITYRGFVFVGCCLFWVLLGFRVVGFWGVGASGHGRLSFDKRLGVRGRNFSATVCGHCCRYDAGS